MDKGKYESLSLCVAALVCSGCPSEGQCEFAFESESIRLPVNSSQEVGFFVNVGEPRVRTNVGDSAVAVSLGPVVGKTGSVQVTCLGGGRETVFGGTTFLQDCATMEVECTDELSWMIAWDTSIERVASGAQGVAGLQIDGIEGEEGNIIITTLGEGPVELIRADVGLSMSNEMFSDSELFYTFTQPEGLHLIQFRCVSSGVQDVRARGVFGFESDSGGFEVMNEADLEVQCSSDVDGGMGGSSGSGGAGGVGGSGGTNAFRYFWIADLEPGSTTSGLRTAGVDIDAVEARVNGQVYFAGQVNGCGFPPFDNSQARDCNQALGPPAGTCETCDFTSGQCADFVADFVSLGGDDREGDSGLQGTLVVSFEGLEVIPSGTDITVYECGSTQNPIKVNERYESFVGPNRRPADSGWVRCHDGAIGNSTCTVP